MKFALSLLAAAVLFVAQAEASSHIRRSSRHFVRAPSKRSQCRPRPSISANATISDTGALASATSLIAVPSSPAASSQPVLTSSAKFRTSSSSAAASTEKASSTPQASSSEAQASSSSSAAPAASPAKSTPTSTGSKKGLGYNAVSATTPFGNQVSWAYNWFSSAGGSLSLGVEYVPMLWGADDAHTKTWASDAAAAIASGSTAVLGFNEPDLSSQSNLSPQDAANAWKQFMQPLAGKATLVSPAVTNGAAPMGTAWLDSFLAACTHCTIDAIAIHIYDAASNVDYYKNYITDVGTKYGKPVWVTEFGATGSTADQQTFLQTMLPFLDGLSSVERYSYFGDFDGTFVSSTGLLALGQTYASST